MFRRKKSVVAVPKIPIVPEADGGSVAKPVATPPARQATPLPVANPVPARPFISEARRHQHSFLINQDTPGGGRRRGRL